MRHRPLGQSGIEASVVAFGAWAVGGGFWGAADDEASVDAIHKALDAGINFIDTAPVYGLGHSEEIVGRAIKGRRDQVVVATKCGLVWHVQKGTFMFDETGTPIHRYLGPESIRYEVEQSLRRLQTDYIDLYQTHWQDATTPIEETMATLLQLKQEGKIRAIGVSNATTQQMDEYRAKGQLDSDQEKYSMLDRGLECRATPLLRTREHRRSGLLADRPGSADRHGDPRPRPRRGRPARAQPEVQPGRSHEGAGVPRRDTAYRR